MKNKKSKKPLIVVAMILMIGLVAGMGAMTYSRYITTTNSGAQTATAAKWGFVVTVDATKLFGTDYTLNTGDTLATKATSDGVAVKASSTANVVAPGTTGSMTITVSGSSEVLAKLSFKLSGTDDTSTDASEIHLGEYYPVKWTLTDGDTLNLTDKKLSEIVTELPSKTKTFAPGSASVSKTYTLTWKWDLENTEETDAKDTLIGLKAAGKNYSDIENLYCGSTRLGGIIDSAAYDAIATSMSFNLAISIEQIQN